MNVKTKGITVTTAIDIAVLFPISMASDGSHSKLAKAEEYNYHPDDGQEDQ